MDKFKFQNENIEQLVKLGYWEWYPKNNQVNFSNGFANFFSFISNEITLKQLLLYLNKNLNSSDYLTFIKYFNSLKLGEQAGKQTFGIPINLSTTKYFELNSLITESPSGMCIAGTIQEVTEQVKYQKLKEKEVLFEKKISEMASRFINESDFESSISITLNELAKLCNADRVSLVKIENNSLTKEFEWVSKNETDEECCFIKKQIPSSESKFFIDLIKEKKLIYYHSPADLPDRLAQFKTNISNSKVNSLIIAGLQKDIKTIGALIVSRTNNTNRWDFSDIHMVKMTCLILGNALKQSLLSKTLKDNEKRLKFALLAGKLGTYELNLQNQSRFVDDRIAKIIGFQSGTLNKIDNWFQNAIHHEHSGLYDDKLTQIIDGDSSLIEIEYMLKCKDNSYKWVSDWGIITEISKDGDPLKMVGIIQDISQRKNTEKALRVAKEKAEENEKLKTAFLANVSHEIRTPMNGISGFAELLYNNMVSDNKKHHYLEIIWKNSNRLLGLINNILDISKLETNQVNIYEREYCLNKLVNEVQDKLQNTNNISSSVKFKINSNIPINVGTVFIDESRVKQVLINLLENSCKFTTAGSILLSIEINNFNEIQFIIKDTGTGISSKFQKHLFNRFSQSDNVIKENKGGTGLGLPIAKGLVNAMGGKIWVESEQGVGSTFYFTLPYKPAKILNTN